MNHKYAPLATLCALLIVFMSSIPDRSLWGDGAINEQLVSNLAHIPAYAVLTFLWFKAFERRKIRGHFNGVIVVILISLILFAISDEIHQSFVPGRFASYMDVGLDLLGILLGFSIFKAFQGQKQKNQVNPVYPV